MFDISNTYYSLLRSILDINEAIGHYSNGDVIIISEDNFINSVPNMYAFELTTVMSY